MRYAQPSRGYRSGIEPVLLAAAIPAQPGERVLEGGSGSGATLLCLTARVPGVIGIGVERDPTLVALANRNAALNDFDTLSFMEGDIERLSFSGLPEARFNHACANPPYHIQGPRSPLPMRKEAKHGDPDLVTKWVLRLAASLRHHATLTLVLPAAQVPVGLAAMESAGCGSIALLPLWARSRRPAKLVLLQAVKGGRGTFRIVPGLVLHGESGNGYAPPADAILREGRALAFYGELAGTPP